MPFQAVTDAGSAVLRGSYSSGEIAECVFGFRLTGTLDQALADMITDDIGDAVTAYNGATSDTFTWNDVVVTDLRTDPAPQFVSLGANPSFPLVGADTSQPLPTQTAALVTWHTAFRGKSFRGRTYLPGFTEADGHANSIESGTLTELAAFRDAILSPANATVFGVISRNFELAPRVPAIISDFTSGIVHGSWRRQKRRAG